LPATVVSTSADATQITVITPQASPDPLPTDAKTSIRITNLVGTAISQTATFTDVFTYEREAKDLVIYSVAPNRGAATGGEQVTIYGKGFVAPAQVDFIIGGTAYSAQRGLGNRFRDRLHHARRSLPAPTPRSRRTFKVTASVRPADAEGSDARRRFTFEKAYPAPQIYLIVPSGVVKNSPPYR